MDLIDARYRQLDEVMGGMGRILICEDTRSGETRALKSIQLGSSSPLATEELRDEAARWLEVGVFSSGSFSVPLERVFTAMGDLFLVMPYYRKGSLRDAYQEDRSAPRRWTWMTHVLLGLWQIAQKGIVHCDLKPENVLIDDGGRALITDFGISRPFQRQGSDYASYQTTSMRGTLPYMAPEQMTTGTLDARTDMWAFAILVLEAITGHHPFALRTEGKIMTAITRKSGRYLKPYLARVPSEVEVFLRKLLHVRPEHRPSTFDEVVGLWSELVAVSGAHRQPSHPVVTIDDAAVASAWGVTFFPAPDAEDVVRIKYVEVDALKQAESLYRLDRFEEAIAKVTRLLAYDGGDGPVLEMFLANDLPEDDYSVRDPDAPGRVVILPGRKTVEDALSIRLRAAVGLIEGNPDAATSEDVRLSTRLANDSAVLTSELQGYLAQVLGLTGHFDEAREVLSSLLDQDPQNHGAWNTLFGMAVMQGGDDRSLANDVARSAVGVLDPSDSPRAAYALAHMCSVVGQIELAIQYAAMALQHDEADLLSLYLLIANLWNSGDRGRAREFYQDLVAMAPRSEQRKRLQPIFEN